MEFTIVLDSSGFSMQQCLALPSTIPKPESTPDNLSEVCGVGTNTYDFELVSKFTSEAEERIFMCQR